MKMIKAFPFILPTILIVVLIAGNTNVWADPSSGEAVAVAVANAVHAGAEAASLSEDFEAAMDEYDRETSGARKKELLNRAKNILSQLVEQANSVESEISTLSKKKLDKVYANKLDRVLSNVLQMRASARKRMQAAIQAG